jgi:DNA-binding NtrC family response regulator
MAPPLILVVDDDLLIRIHIAETLEEAGFDVIEACDAATALAMLQEYPGVQLVCTDVDMPGDLDGIALATHLREHHPHMKVIVISGFSKGRGLPQSIPFLAKPFLSARLLDLAHEQLGVVQEGRPIVPEA